MTDLVDPSSIEQIVGVTRHPTDHWGIARSNEQTVYILHSAECLTEHADLRQCPYSVALNRGINRAMPLWRAVEDRPVRLAIFFGNLIPLDSAEADRG